MKLNYKDASFVGLVVWCGLAVMFSIMENGVASIYMFIIANMMLINYWGHKLSENNDKKRDINGD